MPVTDTVSLSTRGAVLFINGEQVPGVTSLPSVGNATTSEITVTRLDSEVVETQSGLADGGSMTIAGIGAPHLAIFETLAARAQDGVAVSMVVGVGKQTTSGATAGDASDVITGRTMAVAASGTPTRAVFTDGNNSTLVGTAVGDYLRYTTVSGGSDVMNTEAITSITVTGNSVAFGTGLSAAPTLKPNSTVDIIRPGYKWECTCRVTGFETSMEVNEVLRYSLTLRVTSKYTRTAGTPNVTL